MRSLRFGLVINGDFQLEDVWGLLEESSQLQDVSFMVDIDFLPPVRTVRGDDFQALPSVLHLSLGRIDDYKGRTSTLKSFSYILELFPNLQTFTSSGVGLTLAHCSQPQRHPRITLPHLTSISFRDACSEDGWMQTSKFQLILPRLERLDLVGSHQESYIHYLFPSSSPPNTTHLTHLLIDKSTIIEQQLIEHLHLLPNLTHLHARSHDIGDALPLALSYEEGGTLLCPEQVELAIFTTFLKDGVVDEMVRSRKRGGGKDLRMVDPRDWKVTVVPEEPPW